MSATTDLLRISGIEVCYGDAQALFGVDLSIAEGEFVTLLGRNGMGKTTTVRTATGILHARSGSVHFAGQDVSLWASYKIARLGLGLVPEQRQVFPNLTVYENLVATAHNRLQRSDPWTLERVYRLFPRLKERAGNLGANLSGGEQPKHGDSDGVVGLEPPHLSVSLSPSYIYIYIYIFIYIYI